MRSHGSVRLAASAVVAAALTVAAPAAAFAAGPTPSPSPTAGTSATGESAQKQADEAQEQALETRITALQAAADEQAKTAQEADEHYLDAQGDAHDAQQAARDSRTAANAAAATASQSRDRAAAFAARLSRTDMGTMPLNLMLNHASAGTVLGGLSSADQLAAQSQLLYAQAKKDAATAQRLAGVADQRSKDAAAAAASAKAAYAKAKKSADGAAKSVDEAKAQQTALLAKIASEQDTDVAAVCSTLSAADACASVAPTTAPGAPTGVSGSSIGGRVVAFARAHIGDPYVFAAAGPTTWDCSGLTMGAWASVGVDIGIHSATAQYDKAAAAHELVPLADAQPGDLLYYTDGGGDMYHTAIYAGNGDMLEAPHPGADVREVPVRTADLVPQVAHIR